VFRQEALAIPSGFIMPGQLPLSHLCDFVWMSNHYCLPHTHIHLFICSSMYELLK
jgi:hypothetical protein